MANDKVDSKEGILASDQLNLKVLGQDGQVVQFKIKKNTPLRKLMSAYCDRCKLAQSTMRFMFDGTRVDETDTPKSMDMEDGDTIEVFTQQSGGGKVCCHSNPGILDRVRRRKLMRRRKV